MSDNTLDDPMGRTPVDIDLSTREWFDLMCLAHEKDITLNQLVEQLLRELLDELEANLGADK